MKKVIILIAIVMLTCFTFSDTFAEQEERKITYSEWIEKFEELQPDISRLEAEKSIEKIRGIKSTYDLYAMDTSDVVVYKLDEKYILVVWYKPGLPAARGIQGYGSGHPPKDGNYLKHRVTFIR